MDQGKGSGPWSPRHVCSPSSLKIHPFMTLPSYLRFLTILNPMYPFIFTRLNVLLIAEWIECITKILFSVHVGDYISDAIETGDHLFVINGLSQGIFGSPLSCPDNSFLLTSGRYHSCPQNFSRNSSIWCKVFDNTHLLKMMPTGVLSCWPYEKLYNLFNIF